MIYVETNLDEWIEKHGLMVVPFTCPKCKGEFKTTVPIMMDSKTPGLESPVHECGRDMTKVILAPTGKNQEILRKALEAARGPLN